MIKKRAIFATTLAYAASIVCCVLLYAPTATFATRELTCQEERPSVCVIANIVEDLSKETPRFRSAGKQIKTVTIENVTLGAIPEAISTDFPHVENLELINCGISDLSRLRGPDSLHFVDVQGNNIRRLDDGHFVHAKGVTTLHASNNQIEEINENFVRNSPNLVMLDLSENLITTIPERLFVDTRIYSLNLRGNGIRDIEKRFIFLFQLRRLDLSRNQIQAVTKTSFQNCQILNQIDLSYNQIAYFEPESFSTNIQLGDVNLAHNRLTKFQFQMPTPKLFKLDLRHNSIAELSIKQHPNGADFGIINADHNKIEQLDFGKKISAKILGLSHNRLSDLSELAKVSGLQFLDLQSNPLESANFSHLYRLPLLKLNISGSGLTNWKFFELFNITALDTLDISNNVDLFVDTWMVFPQQSRIKSLYLAGLGLRRINSYEIKALFPRLEYIYLNNNKFGCWYLAELKETLYKLQIQLRSDYQVEEKDPKKSFQGIQCVN